MRTHSTHTHTAAAAGGGGSGGLKPQARTDSFHDALQAPASSSSLSSYFDLPAAPALPRYYTPMVHSGRALGLLFLQPDMLEVRRL